MGNVYHITQCPHCDKPHAVASDGQFTVHRGENLQKALEIAQKEGIEEAVRQFCGFCGGFVGDDDECDCGDYREQIVNTPVNIA